MERKCTCGTPLNPTQKKYCSNPCKYKGLIGGKHTLQSRRKMSRVRTGRWRGFAKEDWTCKECGKIISSGSTLCNDCNYYIWMEKARLSWRRYQLDLLPFLEEEYGKLRKEKINGAVFPFCNKRVIIGFTFDDTQGTSLLIPRFQEVKKELREKIAYIPENNTTERRKQLESLGVVIKDSDEFRNLL